jgi:two-component system phosphate regulon sensor histidine kinase PhoR
VSVRVRAKLFAISLGMVTLVVVAVGAFLEARLRDELDARLEGEVVAHARVARVVASQAGLDPAVVGGKSDALCDDLAAANGAQVTIIALDGRVLGDSLLDGEELASIHNHGDRPEVHQALASPVGSARGYSTTATTQLLYVALPIPIDGPPFGVVRVAIPLAEIDNAVWQLRLLLLLAGLGALALAVVVSGVVSGLTAGAVRDSIETARAYVDGQRDEAVADLAAERNRAETILERMRDAVLVVDDAQNVTVANSAAFELLGFDQDRVGSPLHDAIPIPALTKLAAACRTDSDQTAEFEVPPHRHVLARAAPLEPMGGAVIVIHDVTEMRRLERMRRDFVANVSHELRTPVSIIRANAETLLDGALEDARRARSFADGIHRSAERLSALIADLLDLSRLEAGQYARERHEIRLVDAVEGAVDGLSARAEERDVKVDIDVDDDLSLLADAIGLGQVLQNLLDNAIKYSPAGGVVSLRARVTDDVVRIEVQDQGPGIAPKHFERIFERFYRVDKSRSRELGGTGLGLSIVRHICEAMGGRAGVSAAPERGSLFWVELPAHASTRPATATERRAS